MYQQDVPSETNMISPLSPLKKIYQTEESAHPWCARHEGAAVPGAQVQPAVRLSTHTLCVLYTHSGPKQRINPEMKIMPLELTP